MCVRTLTGAVALSGVFATCLSVCFALKISKCPRALNPVPAITELAVFPVTNAQFRRRSSASPDDSHVIIRSGIRFPKPLLTSA